MFRINNCHVQAWRVLFFHVNGTFCWWNSYLRTCTFLIKSIRMLIFFISWILYSRNRSTSFFKWWLPQISLIFFNLIQKIKMLLLIILLFRFLTTSSTFQTSGPISRIGQTATIAISSGVLSFRLQSVWKQSSSFSLIERTSWSRFRLQIRNS